MNCRAPFRSPVTAAVRACAVVGLAAHLVLAAAGAASGERVEPADRAAGEVDGARVRVTGFWWVKNRELRELLTVLEPEGKPLRVLDAAFVEDSILVLQSALAEEGFLSPSGSVYLTLVDGTARSVSWSGQGLPELPRGLAATEATFHLETGIRYHITELHFEGLATVPLAEARSYFIDEGALLGGAKSRKYTPDAVDRGCKSLRVKLQRLGRLDARVAVAERRVDDASGAVAVRIAVDEGPLHRIGRVELNGVIPEEVRTQTATRLDGAAGDIYSPLGRQDLVHQVHVDFYQHGYAEAAVRLVDDEAGQQDREVVHRLTLEVEPGPLVRVGDVRFVGDEKTRRSVLVRATEVRSGQLFDRNRVEADRLGLSGLGAFAAVRADVTPQSPDLWDLTYQLRPSKRIELGVLAGYGSYEKVRGGLELFHANQFGRAERGRLQLVESTKSASADYQLTVPQILGTTAQASARAFGLDREEVSFDRREMGVSIGARRHSERFNVDVAARYQYEDLRADNVVPDLLDAAPEDSRVGAITFDISQDRRDNPLTPKTGYELSFAVETAAQAIGSEVNYQKLDIKASWHARIGRSLVTHLGLRHGAIWAWGESEEEIPINKRFFPGGDSTVRGYSEGEAAPRGANGEIIGAEVSTILNLELEAALTDRVSALVFVDAGLTGASVNDYPGDQVRLSGGVGLRYNSLIGPVRLEYGYNIVRETGDQSGALQFSLGFPF